MFDIFQNVEFADVIKSSLQTSSYSLADCTSRVFLSSSY